MSEKTCAHVQQVNQNIKAKTPNGCEECLQMGSDWVHLRLCLSCGHLDVVTLLPISMALNTSNQHIILSLNRMSPVKTGNGVMLTRGL
jgi:hypothetical protein